MRPSLLTRSLLPVLFVRTTQSPCRECVGDVLLILQVPPASLPFCCRFGDSSFLYKATLALSGFLEEVRTTVLCLHRCTRLRCQLAQSLQGPYMQATICAGFAVCQLHPQRDHRMAVAEVRLVLLFLGRQSSAKTKKWRASKGRRRHEIGRRIKCSDMEAS